MGTICSCHTLQPNERWQVRGGEKPFWENAIRWLVRDPRAALLLLETDRRAVVPGESVELRARALSEDYSADVGATVAFSVADQSGASVLEKTVEVAEDQPPPSDHEGRVYVDVTAHAPTDVFAIRVSATHVADIMRAKSAIQAEVAAAVKPPRG